jgi:hypothetical protein
MPHRSRSCWPSPRPDVNMSLTNALMARRVATIVAAGLVALTTACASIGPKPWQHDVMARPEMQPNPYPLLTSAEDHIYFSKEASSGGRSFAGGGCGCN